MSDLGRALTRRDFAMAMMATGGSLRRQIEKAEPPLQKGLELTRSWNGEVCRLQLKNRSATPLRPGEITLFDWQHSLPPATAMYGEGFQMLSQTGGTLATPMTLGGYEDARHYRIAQPGGATTVYNLLLLSPAAEQHLLMAFTSSRRFAGRFHLRPNQVTVTCDTEGLTLEPGESWELEEFVILEGKHKSLLLQQLASLLRANHPMDLPAAPPRGWCSWVAFAGKVTAEGVLANAKAAKDRFPSLKYIQIDDGYMERLGDWLTPSSTFQGSIKDTLHGIRDLGLESALWVAPFIAEKQSRVLAEHPSWFVRDEAGAPLASDRVTFGGWKRPPWFALDGTNPEVQEHLAQLFHTLSQEWGSTYFKLDANFWGAIHGGRFHDPKATRVEAYRRGMAAVRRGAGAAFLLGCNHPIWPSIGLIHGSRSSGDISPKWPSVAETSRENLSRAWQNSRLWWNDPDTVQFAGSLTPSELEFHLTVLHATQGLVMSSDQLSQLSGEQVARLQKLTTVSGGVPEFDERLEHGSVQSPAGKILYQLNWGAQPSSRSLPQTGKIRDFWTEQHIESAAIELAPHSGRVLVIDSR